MSARATCRWPVCRKLLGPDKIVGATAKTVEAAVAAYNDGADYLGTGAIYPTTTHVTTKVTPVSVLNDVCRAVPDSGGCHRRPERG